MFSTSVPNTVDGTVAGYQRSGFHDAVDRMFPLTFTSFEDCMDQLFLRFIFAAKAGAAINRLAIIDIAAIKIGRIFLFMSDRFNCKDIYSINSGISEYVKVCYWPPSVRYILNEGVAEAGLMESGVVSIILNLFDGNALSTPR